MSAFKDFQKYLAMEEEKRFREPVILQVIRFLVAIPTTMLLCSILFFADLSHVWYKTTPLPSDQVNDFSIGWLFILFWALVLKHYADSTYHKTYKWLQAGYKLLSMAVISLLLIVLVRVSVWWVSWQF